MKERIKNSNENIKWATIGQQKDEIIINIKNKKRLIPWWISVFPYGACGARTRDLLHAMLDQSL